MAGFPDLYVSIHILQTSALSARSTWHCAQSLSPTQTGQHLALHSQAYLALCNPHLYLHSQCEVRYSAKMFCSENGIMKCFDIVFKKKSLPYLQLKLFAEFWLNQWINCHVQKKSHFWQVNCLQKNSFKYSVKRYTCTIRCAAAIIFVGVFHGSLPTTRWNCPSPHLRKDSVTTETLKRVLNNASFLNGSV